MLQKGDKRRGNNEGTIVQRKDGRWCAALTVGKNDNGTPKRKYIYGKTRSEVKDKLNKSLYELNLGTFIDSSKMTFGDWLNTWLYEYKKSSVRPSTFQSYEYLIRVHIMPSLGSTLLKSLRPEHLQRLYNEKFKSGRADGEAGGLNPKTIKNMHNVMHEALDQAQKNNLIIQNPSDAVNTPKHIKKEIPILSTNDQLKFLKALKDERLSCIYILALGSGMRQGELLALKWNDIDMKKGIIKVRRTVKRTKVFDENRKSHTEVIYQEPKTKAGNRDIPLPENVLKELKAHKKNQSIEKINAGEVYQNLEEFVFVNEMGKCIEATSLAKDYKRILKKAGLLDINFHALRHTYATRLLEANEHPKVVQELLGHTDITMTLNTYSHVMPDIKIAAANKLNSLFGGNKKSSNKEG